MSENVILQDKNGDTILPATSWSNIQDKPSGLVTSGMLPKLGVWTQEGVTFENGAYDWDHANNGLNTAYRIADMGSFKIVEIRAIFAVNHDIQGGNTSDQVNIRFPKKIQPDGDEEQWVSAGAYLMYCHIRPDMSVGVFCPNWESEQKYTANSLLSFHIMYFTTL